MLHIDITNEEVQQSSTTVVKLLKTLDLYAYIYQVYMWHVIGFYLCRYTIIICTIINTILYTYAHLFITYYVYCWFGVQIILIYIWRMYSNIMTIMWCVYHNSFQTNLIYKQSSRWPKNKRDEKKSMNTISIDKIWLIHNV